MKTNRAKLSAMVKLGQRGALLASTLCLGGMAQAQTTYNVAGLADFTGPFADIMKDMTGCRRAVLDWWSEEVGKAQGVALRIKDFDTRYDVAQVASLWPGIKSELNPVVILGVGGADTNALQQRLPNDKVSLILGTAGYGFAWKGDNWAFNGRATYPHEAAAFYTWMQKKSGSTAPLKVGVISSEVSPAYVDIHKGVEKFAKDNPKIIEVVETIYTEAQPTDLTQQVNRLIRKGATMLQVYIDEVVKLPFHIPLYGSHISLFPILAAIAIFFYMKMTSGDQQMAAPSQEGMPDMAKMMKIMIYVSPLMMLFFFNSYGAGLSLYNFISNLITIGIMIVIKRYFIDSDKIHAQIQENKLKEPKKQGKFQKKIQEVMEQAEAQKAQQKKK